MLNLCPTAVYSGAAQTTAAETPQCSTGLPAAGLLQPSAELSELVPPTNDNGSSVQFIAPGMKFNCHGQITEWTALVTLVDPFFTYQFTLQVWRPSSEVDGKFELIGSNLINPRLRESDGNRDFNLTFFLLTSQISEDNRIRFQPNDVLGWYIPTREGINPGFGVAVHSNGSSPQLLSKIVSGAPCELYTCDEEVQFRTFLPLITLQYGEEIFVCN